VPPGSLLPTAAPAAAAGSAAAAATAAAATAAAPAAGSAAAAAASTRGIPPAPTAPALPAQRAAPPPWRAPPEEASVKVPGVPGPVTLDRARNLAEWYLSHCFEAAKPGPDTRELVTAFNTLKSSMRELMALQRTLILSIAEAAAATAAGGSAGAGSSRAAAPAAGVAAAAAGSASSGAVAGGWVRGEGLVGVEDEDDMFFDAVDHCQSLDFMQYSMDDDGDRVEEAESEDEGEWVHLFCMGQVRGRGCTSSAWGR
jgi:hypothetical protein